MASMPIMATTTISSINVNARKARYVGSFIKSSNSYVFCFFENQAARWSQRKTNDQSKRGLRIAASKTKAFGLVFFGCPKDAKDANICSQSARPDQIEEKKSPCMHGLNKAKMVEVEVSKPRPKKGGFCAFLFATNEEKSACKALMVKGE